MERAVAELDLEDSATDIPERGDRRLLHERGAAPSGEALVSGVAAVRVRDPGLRLEEAVVLVAEPPLRPALDDLASVEALVWHALRVHGRGVVGQRDRRLAWSDVE